MRMKKKKSSRYYQRQIAKNFGPFHKLDIFVAVVLVAYHDHDQYF
jgi:hypothetical protein